MDRPVQKIALALVRRGQDWLVARRPAHVHLGGQWEFPGGKCDDGESVTQAALRELAEECGVTARALFEMSPTRVDYGDRVIDLHPIVCEWVAGEATPLASEECRWLPLSELRRLDMPAVNALILQELQSWA